MQVLVLGNADITGAGAIASTSVWQVAGGSRQPLDWCVLALTKSDASRSVAHWPTRRPIGN